MGYRKQILSRHGYDVAYEQSRRYRGSEMMNLCIAVKGGVKYCAFRICAPAYPEHFHRIQNIQGSIPHMARIVGPIDDVVLIEHARGRLLWEMETPPADLTLVQDQLIEFARATKRNELIHGDLRPWNVFFDNDLGVQVIDWWTLSCFADDLLPRGGLHPRRVDLLGQGHYAKFHRDLVEQGRFTEIDAADAKLIGGLLRGEIGLTDGGAWQGHYSSYGRFLWQ